MNRFLLLFICAILTGGQAAVGANSNEGSSSASPSVSKMYYGNIDFNRALPESGSRVGQQPVCLVEGTAIYVYDYGIDEVNRLAKEGILIGSDSEDNYINLEQGNVLINPDKDILIGTSHGQISVGSGATVFIMQSPNGLVVYDLSQTQPQQVTVAVNKKKTVLETGRMLVLTRENVQDFEKLSVNCHAIAYSQAQPLDLHGNAVRAFLANFSVASALITIEPLKRLTVSHNKRDKLALEQLVKNAGLSSDIANIIDKPLKVANSSY